MKYTEMSINQRIWLRKRQKEMLQDGMITQGDYEHLIKEYPLFEDTTID